MYDLKPKSVRKPCVFGDVGFEPEMMPWVRDDTRVRADYAYVYAALMRNVRENARGAVAP